MKNLKKLLAMCLSVIMIFSCIPAAFAADVANATIDEAAKGSLTLYKYDLTNAEKDGVWDSSYVSTGVYDESVNKTLGEAVRAGDDNNQSDLGNGEASYGYAVKGVEFTYLKVADIVQFTESERDGVTYNHVEVLYGIDKTIGADLLNALGLQGGDKRYTNADQLEENKYFYQSDVLIDALALALETNSTSVKNALESYIAANGGTAMPLTDAYGKSEAKDLELGLYLVVETKVPEMVTSTCNPFFVSIPMTSVDGTNATDGGTRWIYDITIYPKNSTGIPTLEKTLRENQDDTGKHNGTSDDITDGYAHTGTASDGDVIDYQIISTLPSITSESTYLSEYTFIDTLSAGLTYNKQDVVIEFFSDAACTNLLNTWNESDGLFTVSYSQTEANESVMTISMTEAGLEEINTNDRVYSDADSLFSGYSDCTIRITYKATMDSDNSVVYGDSGNPNKVVLVWKRSSQEYFDTLVDDAHVFTYAMELTKLFSDGNGDYKNVEFIMQNDTDGYFVKAELNEEEGIHKKRREFEEFTAKQRIPEHALDGVRQGRSIRYQQGGDPAHVMDLYCPTTIQTPTPVIINIHGGGLITGSKDFNRHFCINLCKMGFIVFSVEYRLCPEVTFFQQLEDIYAAMNHIDSMIPELKGDPGYCFMVGDSAGAMLALYAAAVQRNPKLARTAAIRPCYLEIRALGLISGMFYTTKLDPIGLLMPKVFYGPHYKKHPFYPYLNPDHEAVSMYLPPCLLTTSKHDNLRSYSYHMTAAIRLQEVPCILYDYGDDPELTHAFPVFAPEHPKSMEVIEDIASFFTNHK